MPTTDRLSTSPDGSQRDELLDRILQFVLPCSYLGERYIRRTKLLERGSHLVADKPLWPNNSAKHIREGRLARQLDRHVPLSPRSWTHTCGAHLQGDQRVATDDP